MNTYSCSPHPGPFSQSEKGATLSGVIGKHLKLCYVLGDCLKRLEDFDYAQSDDYNQLFVILSGVEI
jgi:hypothetical protein